MSGVSGAPANRSVATVVLATTTATVAVFPVFFLGGLAVLLRAELGFDRAALGFAFGLFFGASALSSVPLGRWVERVGVTRSAALAMGTSTIVMLGLALATGWGHVAVLMVVGGIANGLAQPAANMALARGVRTLRQGLAFGIKQSGPPLAGLLAGASVPVIGLTLGWRWGFVAGGLLGGIVAVRARMSGAPLAQPSVVRSRGSRLRQGDPPIAPLALLALAGGCASAASQPLGAFLVESAVDRGMSATLAGVILAVSSALSIASRLVVGHIADRWHRGTIGLVMAMVCVGAIAYLSLARVASPLVFAVSSVVAFMFGWGWNGLFNFAIVKANRNAPGAASGIALVGLASGAVVGPVVFGLVVSRSSFAVGWTLCACSAAVSVLLLGVARRWLRGHDVFV